MAKTIAINPSWYWPDDVPRLIGVPPFILGHMVAGRWARRKPDRVALADAGRSITYAELNSKVTGFAGALRSKLDEGGRALLHGPSGIDGVISVLGAVAACARPLLVDGSIDSNDAAGLAAQVGATVVNMAELIELGASGDLAGGEQGLGSAQDLVLDLVTPDGWLAGHSSYSLVSGALSLAQFLQVENGGGSWLCAMPLSSWEGLYSAMVPLYCGATAVVANERGMSDDIADAVEDHGVSYTLLPYDASQELARRKPRRLVDAFKRSLQGLLLSTQRPFSPGDRRKLKKVLDVPVLTVYGLTECGPILASHPSWYVDESVGIPVTNVEVQPANPQTGEPIDTNWELLDYASMVIRAPQLMACYEGQAASDEKLSARIEQGWFKTWAKASFDANGMMYLVD